MTHCLIVDDNDDNRLIARHMLEELGIHSTEVSNASDALPFVTSGEVDCVLLDWMMPDIDGMEFLELVRESKVGKTIRIVVCTAKTSEADKQKALSLGASGYITKPLTLQSLSDGLISAGVPVHLTL